jgi:hypothetical protein
MGNEPAAEPTIPSEEAREIHKTCVNLFEAKEVADSYRREHNLPILPGIPKVRSPSVSEPTQPRPDG